MELTERTLTVEMKYNQWWQYYSKIIIIRSSTKIKEAIILQWEEKVVWGYWWNDQYCN